MLYNINTKIRETGTPLFHLNEFTFKFFEEEYVNVEECLEYIEVIVTEYTKTYAVSPDASIAVYLDFRSTSGFTSLNFYRITVKDLKLFIRYRLYKRFIHSRV